MKNNNMTNNMLEVSRLRKRFGGVVANDDITLEVERGSIVGLIGPNGSGKTTLFNSIMRQHAPDAGFVRFDGCDLAGLAGSAVARLGLARTFQQAHVYEGLTCLENVQMSAMEAGERLGAMARLAGGAHRDKGMQLLAFVDLADRSGELAGRLSFGQRKLLELAMALMSEPQMLLLDEPTAGVNPTLVERLVERLREVNASFGLTLLIIEHNMRVVMALAGKIHCLAHGRVLASGTPEEIRSDPRVIDAYLGAR